MGSWPIHHKKQGYFSSGGKFTKEMKFQTDAVVNYDPHHFISIRRHVNNNKPFEHHEVAGMDESANWMDYP